MMYFKGNGVPRDYAQAVSWYRKAADQGDTDAQYALGVSNYNGEGVSKDNKLAYFWWLLSSAQGFEKAIERRDYLEKTLTSQQCAKIQAAATNWKPIAPAR